eukprot:gene25077-31491_t
MPTRSPSVSAAPSTFAGSYLLHRYSFNDGTARDSVSGLNGTLSNVHVVGGRVVFNHLSNSFVQFPPNILGSSADMTIELWVQTGVNGVNARLFQFGQDLTANENSLMLYSTPSGMFEAWTRYTSSFFLTSSVPFSSRTSDTHVVMTYATSSGSALISNMYVNGTLAQTGSTAYSVLSSSAGGYLGKSFASGVPQLNGSISEFRVWSTVLSANQVLLNYEQGPDECFNCPSVTPTVAPSQSPSRSPSATPSLTPSVTPSAVPSKNPSTATPSVTPSTAAPSTFTGSYLLHRYSFNDGTARDSISGLNGTLFNAVVANGRAHFDPSSSSFVQLPPNILGSSTDLSIELWCQLGNNTEYARLFQIGQSLTTVNGNSVILYSVAGGYLRWWTDYASFVPITSTSTFNSFNSDVHIVLTYTTVAGTLTSKMYINGTLSGSSSGTSITLFSTAGGYLGKSFAS